MSNIFHKFEVGTVFNPYCVHTPVERVSSMVALTYPSRLNGMAIDPGKITSNENMVFTPGEVVFPVGFNKSVVVEATSGVGEIEISDRSKRKPLIRHAAMLVQAALGVKEGLRIDVDNQREIKHCGLGSSSGLIAGVAAAVNELYGARIPDQDMVMYLAQNHGEEIEGEEHRIQQVQCIGGSAAAGLFEGGAMILAGESQVIKTMRIHADYAVTIGIPKDFTAPDADYLMREEEKALPKFLHTGRTFGPQIAYRMLHDVLPAMNRGNLMPLGDLLFDYRFNMGSIDNCSFVFPRMVDIAANVRYLKEENRVPVLALSSVGPAFFAISKEPDLVRRTFEDQNMHVINTHIFDTRYIVNERL